MEDDAVAGIHLFEVSDNDLIPSDSGYGDNYTEYAQKANISQIEWFCQKCGIFLYPELCDTCRTLIQYRNFQSVPFDTWSLNAVWTLPSFCRYEFDVRCCFRHVMPAI